MSKNTAQDSKTFSAMIDAIVGRCDDGGGTVDLDSEFARGMVNMVADLFPYPGTSTDQRMSSIVDLIVVTNRWVRLPKWAKNSAFATKHAASV